MHNRLNNQNVILEESHQKPLWPKIHLIALIAFLIRLILALTSDHINHPDEIFQYLEQAHRLEFDYGFIPWEYRYGIRSWILPGLLYGLLHILHALHLDNPNFYIPIVKLFFASSLYLLFILHVLLLEILPLKILDN